MPAPAPTLLRLLPGLLTLALASCGADSIQQPGVSVARSGNVRVRVKTTGPDGILQEQSVTLRDLTSLSDLSGKATKVISRATVRVDNPVLFDAGYVTDQGVPTLRLLALPLADREPLFVIKPGASANTRFLADSAELVPADEDTWSSTTNYYNIQQSTDYFQELQPSLVLGSFRSFIHTSLQIDDFDGGKRLIRDNAAYLSPLDAIVFAEKGTRSVQPYERSIALMGHEYAHRVFHELIVRYADPTKRWPSSRSKNIFDAVNEGLADFHGAGVTCAEPSGCRPKLTQGFQPADAALRRDLSQPACLTPALKQSIEAEGTFDEYPVGTVWAAALFQAGETTGKLKQMQRAVMQSYSDERPEAIGFRQRFERTVRLQSDSETSWEALTDSVAAHIDDAPLLKEWCGLATDRLRLACTSFPCAALPHCPADTPVKRSCQ